MNLRSKVILEAAIKEYIKSGKPVSSKELVKKYDFRVKDATIRNELNSLTKEGFLEQLHTSGGRVPTDRGYQFFVENTIDDVVDSTKILNNHSNLLENLRTGCLRDFVEAISEETHLLGAGEREKEFHKCGLDSLFEQLDLETKNEFHDIVSDFEMLDRRFENFRSKVSGLLKEPEVFIGKKSPITKSENLSVIVDSYNVGDQKVFIAIIGPKRMDYNKNLSLLKSLKNIID